MSKEEWIKTMVLLQELKKDYKENLGIGIPEFRIILVILSVLLVLVQDKIKGN